MYIAIVDFDINAARRGEAVDVLLDEAKAVRAMDGNQAFRVFADPEQDTRVTLVHEWASRAAMDVYLGGSGFAASGQKLRPMMIGAPLSRRFEAQIAEFVR